MKLLRLISAILLACSIFSFSPSFTQPVMAVDPFEPFSVEGNPDRDYYIRELFPLFRYIKPPKLKVFENEDRSRKYEALEICGKDRDYRDYVCNNLKGSDADDCDGGGVDLCHKGARRGEFARTAYSSNGSCTATDADPPGTVGKCRYRQNPRIKKELRATDFSEMSRATLTPVEEEPTTPDEQTAVPDSLTSGASVGLVFNKLQNEWKRYAETGTDNPITWGSHRLQLSQDEQVVKQLLVVTRAKQSKNTVTRTGEWPLGWVDWGYKTANGKTLIEIHDELPGGISGAGTVIAEGVDDFFLNAGNLDAVSDVSDEKEYVAKEVAKAASRSPQPEWVRDLLQAPVYSPSFRQGYARGSICVFDLCCPGNFCPFPDLLFGNANNLYADTSVSQAFGAALDDLLLNYSLEEGAKIFRDLVAGNQLIRFATSASDKAIPSEIHRRLSKEITDPCFKYIKGPGDFTLGWFGFYMDYADPPTFLDGERKCPGWAIQPELTKETGGAVPQSQSLLGALVNLIWGNQEDDVATVKHHFITIPDAMGQYLSEIEDPVFQIRDSLVENEQQNEYNETLSNIVDAMTDKFYAGKGIAVGDAKRRPSYLSCSDQDYSAPQLTSIETYALGTRIGCYDQASTASVCTSDDFVKLFGETDRLPLPEAVTLVKSSTLFVNGGLNPDLAEAYAQVAEETGVPCEVLAGHHFEEATGRFFDGSDPREFSAANGSLVGKNGFLESVRNAAKGVLRHPPTSLDGLITTMSNFNGGGNSNCQLSFGAPIPWGGCPREFIGDDDPYATNMLDTRHTGMYLLYCGDSQKCMPPKPYGDRPGAFSVALIVHDVLKNSSSSPDASSTPIPTSSPTNTAVKKIDPAGVCGDGYIDTALGCLPYGRDALIATLLRFIVGMSGLASLVTMMIAVFQIMTSAGDTKKVQKGRELFTAAVAGLLFVIFSVTLLRIIAGDIIKLPGF